MPFSIIHPFVKILLVRDFIDVREGSKHKVGPKLELSFLYVLLPASIMIKSLRFNKESYISISIKYYITR